MFIIIDSFGNNNINNNNNNNNDNNKRTNKIVNFAIPDDHRIKLKESEKNYKYSRPCLGI